MKISIAKERRPDERRVACSPDTAKRLIGQGHEVLVEAGAGLASAYPDAAYEAAGAAIAADTAAALGGGDVLLKVQRPLRAGEGAVDELALMRRGMVLVGLLQPLQRREDIDAYAKAGITAFAMELVPRITRAQSMDVLSSQANLAGYKAVLDAAGEFGRAMPMMMTAAGTIAPARVLVMGAGVAGLQAIATARRLGAVVSATDVRYAAKEQVESLGASFLAVDPDAMKAMETAGGYAKEMGEDFARRQREHVTEALKKTDIVICTALVPGRKAPVLITRAMVAVMRPGSVIVDLAVEQGGNVEGSELGKTVQSGNGVSIIGHANVPSRIAVDASQLYARNLLAFLALITDKEKHLKIDTADEIVKAALLTRDGAVVHPQMAPQPAAGG
ncbi:MAG TPA: Re/Si-specific NAD(P)(+) transhydrogenase subunit alpha [Stellaceae bacterium]|jgi:NAD(P) transhydrogenase subunit alpha|nr:Re/Si-specific NAD(P)(+) transhydrogenase subunit alpha [Stellaceae bacterium]